MKKLLFAVTALAALSLLAPSTGFADGANNQVGCYTDADMTSPNAVSDPFTNTLVYVVVSNPYNHVDSPNHDIIAISGIEFRFITSGINHMVTATEWAQPNVLDVGSDATGHVAGFADPFIVGEGGYVHVCTKTIFTMEAGVVMVHLGSSESISDPGHMVVLDSAYDPGHIIRCYPSSGDYADPVFSINGDIVATENTSFDGIKAMYR